ncbi:hypothetical protein AAFF_G00291630 [Aldrovandia affinis]|uniref:Uncharacterized protein n=1 Tax=Aldrovandia affinis TaxID=143900 RepID=A0AAD7WRS8_9TELE|nr:hypothetical protein AAFF_G00291630 [Aldrovandia affinis]
MPSGAWGSSSRTGHTGRSEAHLGSMEHRWKQQERWSDPSPKRWRGRLDGETEHERARSLSLTKAPARPPRLLSLPPWREPQRGAQTPSGRRGNRQR